MKSCKNCVYVNGKCFNDNNMEVICLSSDMRYWKYDDKKPMYSFEVAKQLLFDIAMDIEYGNYVMLSDKTHDIMNIIKELDKMKVVE